MSKRKSNCDYEEPCLKRITRSMTRKTKEDMPDEILFNLFQSFDLFTLCTLAEVNVKFRTVANVVFYSSMCLDLEVNFDRLCDIGTGRFTARKVRKFLFNFSIMDDYKIIIDFEKANSERDFIKTLELIEKYCIIDLNSVSFLNMPINNEEIYIACLKLGLIKHFDEYFNDEAVDSDKKLAMCFNINK